MAIDRHGKQDGWCKCPFVCVPATLTSPKPRQNHTDIERMKVASGHQSSQYPENDRR